MNRGALVPKLLKKFEDVIEEQKIKQKFESENDYIKIKQKLMQKAKKMNLAATNSKDVNFNFPCKIKPRKA